VAAFPDAEELLLAWKEWLPQAALALGCCSEDGSAGGALLLCMLRTKSPETLHWLCLPPLHPWLGQGENHDVQCKCHKGQQQQAVNNSKDSSNA